METKTVVKPTHVNSDVGHCAHCGCSRHLQDLKVDADTVLHLCVTCWGIEMEYRKRGLDKMKLPVLPWLGPIGVNK